MWVLGVLLGALLGLCLVMFNNIKPTDVLNDEELDELDKELEEENKKKKMIKTLYLY